MHAFTYIHILHHTMNTKLSMNDRGTLKKKIVIFTICVHKNNK